MIGLLKDAYGKLAEERGVLSDVYERLDEFVGAYDRPEVFGGLREVYDRTELLGVWIEPYDILDEVVGIVCEAWDT